MKTVAWIALGLSMAGSLVAGGAYWRVRTLQSVPVMSPREPEGLHARIAKLESDLGRAREEIARLSHDAPSPPPGGHEPAAPSNELAELRKRIEILERQAAAGRQVPGEMARGMKPNPGQVEVLKKRLNDTTKTEFERASALTMLRVQGAHKADDVVDTALALLAQSTEARTRALILRNLHGSHNARMVPAVINSLTSDADEDVRDEAAETLDDFVARPEVQAALEAASTGDASEKVRRTAKASLAKK